MRQKKVTFRQMPSSIINTYEKPTVTVGFGSFEKILFYWFMNTRPTPNSLAFMLSPSSLKVSFRSPFVLNPPSTGYHVNSLVSPLATEVPVLSSFRVIVHSSPSFSPASTAGRVRMIRSASLFFRAMTESAIARYVFPVPAGPIANVSVFFRIVSI